MEFVIVLVVVAVVVFVITGPLRASLRRDGSGESAPVQDVTASELAELEAERDAKYREIRDAQLDHDTGKLSDADFEVLERSLRAEAIEILHAIDRERGEEPAPPD